MSDLFLYRLKDSDDRDACAYIRNNYFPFECGHYFSAEQPCGACYSGREFPAYDEIETILTQTEYETFLKINEAVRNLGYGIEKDDDRYKAGMMLRRLAEPIMQRLKSQDASDFYQEICASEEEWLMEEYGLSFDDIVKIFEHYGLDYHDRAVVSCVFSDIDECAEEEAYSLGWINHDSYSSRYFDFEAFGNDLLQEESYLELDDGRIVYLNY